MVCELCWLDKGREISSAGGRGKGEMKGVQRGGFLPQRARTDSKKYTIGTRPHACTHPMLSVSTAANK